MSISGVKEQIYRVCPFYSWCRKEGWECRVHSRVGMKLFDFMCLGIW